MAKDRVVYVYYERGWPVCTGSLAYVSKVTGRLRGSLMSSATKRTV